MEGEAAVIALDLEGVAVSTGSACSSGALEPSHVLTAMGLRPEVVQSSLRFSLCHYNTEEEIDQTVGVLENVLSKGCADWRVRCPGRRQSRQDAAYVLPVSLSC